MKKSKVLIPAMALLLFSTAASITGTVAWFTSTRVFEMSAGEFEIAQLDGNLEVELDAGVGTVKSDAKTISLAGTTRLLDASVDKGGNAWRLDSEGNSTYASYGAASEANWLVRSLTSGSTVKNYYAAVSWKMSISYTFASEKAGMGIYMDLKKSMFSSSAASDGAGGNKGDSAKGFRIMFIEDAANKKATVWGNHKAELTSIPAQWSDSGSYTQGNVVVHDQKLYERNDQSIEGTGWVAGNWNEVQYSSFDLANSPYNLKYVTAADDDLTANPQVHATADYKKTVEGDTNVKGDYFTSASSSSDAAYSTWVRWKDGTGTGAGSEYKAERIATIPLPGEPEEGEDPTNTSSVDITCIAWFEGEDPNVVNDTAMKAVSASMTFYARCDALASD